MDDPDARITIGILLAVGSFLLALFYAAITLADELTQFIRDRGEAHHLAQWRIERERAARIRRGTCPNDSYPLHNKTCPKCGWTP